MENQEKPDTPPEKPCKHEYVRIFQRKLKGLERRLVAQRAYLPVGFKLGDFQHLGENSYCFCTKCRTRLYPKRSQAEKELARQERAKQRLDKLSAEAENESDLELDMEVEPEQDSQDDEKESDVNIHVEEMDVELVGVEDIVQEGVKLQMDESGDEDGDQCAADEEDR